jgi:hypothetical protein
MRIIFPSFLRSFLTLSFITLWFTVAQASGGQIQGKVKEDGGKALAGVTVKATRSVTRSLDDQDTKQKDYEVKTNDKGEFVLSGLLAGSYTLTFELTGYRTFVTRRIEIAAGETFKVQRAIEMSREQAPFGLIRGATLDSSGYSLPHVQVTIERTDNKKFKKLEKVSTEGGEFAFRVPAEKGTYRLTASAEGFTTVSKEITIDGDEIRQVVLQLEKKN